MQNDVYILMLNLRSYLQTLENCPCFIKTFIACGLLIDRAESPKRRKSKDEFYTIKISEIQKDLSYYSDLPDTLLHVAAKFRFQHYGY